MSHFDNSASLGGSVLGVAYARNKPTRDGHPGALARVQRLASAGNHALQEYRLRQRTELLEFDEIWRTMDEISPAVMAHSLWDLGYLRDPQEEMTPESVAATCSPSAKYQSLMSQWLGALAGAGMVTRLAGATPRFAGAPLDIVRVRERIEHAVVSLDRPTAYPGFIDYFKTCVSHQTNLLTGLSNPQKLLFPAGSSRLVEGLYRTNPAARMQNCVAAAVVQAASRDWSGSRPIRILEIGAGTGATTAAMLAVLEGPYQYYFTDISRFFLRRGARELCERANLTYELLDIDRPGTEQGFERGSFDIIVAANVLHTAKHVDRALEHLQELLADDGVVIAIETTANTTLQMITFGHFEGVCHFQDIRRNSNLPFLSCLEWFGAFKVAGLQSVSAIPSPNAGSQGWTQHVLLGTKGSA